MRTRTALIAAALLALAGCGGSGHPAASPTVSAPPSPPPTLAAPPALTCASFPVKALAHDMRQQDKLAAVAFPPGSGIPRATVADIRAGAWVDPGTYSGDLDQFMATASSVSASDFSKPAPLSTDVVALSDAATTLTGDKDVAAGSIPVGDWRAFRDAIAALAVDCGQSIH